MSENFASILTLIILIMPFLLHKFKKDLNISWTKAIVPSVLFMLIINYSRPKGESLTVADARSSARVDRRAPPRRTAR